MASTEETNMSMQAALIALQQAFEWQRLDKLTDDQITALNTAISDFQSALDLVLTPAE